MLVKGATARHVIMWPLSETGTKRDNAGNTTGIDLPGPMNDTSYTYHKFTNRQHAWILVLRKKYYSQTYNISDTFASNRIVYHADVLFIIKLTHDLNRLHKDNYKTRRETFKFWDLVRLILEIFRYAFRMAGSTPFQIVTHPVSGWILSLCRGYIKHM